MTEKRIREKRNMTLDPGANALLEGVGNASEYVSLIVEQRAREWQEAVAVLEEYGWRKPEVMAAADALNGAYEMLQARPPSWLAIELLDAQELNGICEKWDVSADRWRKHVNEVAKSHELAWAVRIVAREIWAENAACEAAVERLGRRGKS